MMKELKNNKGYTLMELIVVLSIISIVLTPLFAFFYSNLKTYTTASDQMEAQYQAQIAMDELIHNVIEVKRLTDFQSSAAIKSITFEVNNKYLRISHNNGSKKLSIGRDANPSGITLNEYAVNIEEFNITFIPTIDTIDTIDTTDPNNYKFVKGLHVELKSKVNNAEVEIQNTVYFRNWKESP